MNIRNCKQYIQTFLKIKTKTNKVMPFLLNEPQKKLYKIIKELHQQQKPIRLIILKARQMGFSTLIEGIIFHRTATKENVSSMIITHKDEATTNLFNMSKLFFDYLPQPVRPMRRASNAKELVFENPTKIMAVKEKQPGLRSKIKCATAGGDGVGRSDTLTNVHASEYAFWTGDKKATLSGLLQAVPSTANTFVAIESTANGFEDYKKMWDMAVAGEIDFTPIFFAWFELSEYQMPYDGFELTETEIKLKQTHNLTNDQLQWRRWSIKNNCGGDIDLFNQDFPSTPEEAFLSTGNCVFDKVQIADRLNQIRKTKPLKEGHFEYKTYFNGSAVLIDDNSINWIDNCNGYIKIYIDKKESYPYVIGGDTAGDGSDSFVGQVINNISGEQVATLRHQMDEDLYTMQMYCLGKYYNTALIAIEANYTTYPLNMLHKLGYSRQYYRESQDNVTNKMKYKYGYRTDRITRPLILAELIKLVREQVNLINDEATLKEMLTFVKNSIGRAEAMSGEHDDCVMALAIAYGARGQQASFLQKAETESNYDLDGFVNYS